MVAATNALIGFPSLRSKLSIGPSTPAYDASYPATNALILPLSQVARTADATLVHTQAAFLFDRPRYPSLFGLIGHTLSLVAQWQLLLYADTALTTLLYDTGMNDVWPVVFPYGSLPWGDEHALDGKYNAEDIAGYTWSTPYRIPDGALAAPVAGFVLKLSDVGNAAGKIDYGLLEVATATQLTINPDWGMEFGWRSRSQAREALGGTLSTRRLRPQRVWRGTIKYAKRDQSMALWFELFRQMDITEPFLWWLNPTETSNQLRNFALVRNASISNAKRASFDRDEIAFDFAEVL